MGISLNAADVFETAIRIEHDSAAFYRKAAHLAEEEELRRQLRALADMEEDHAAEFKELKKLLLEPGTKGEWFEPESDAVGYLRAFARDAYFNVTVDASQFFAQQPTKKDVLSFALERERDSILFYTGIQATIPKKKDREKVEAIILQEMGHVGLLHALLEEL